MKTTFREIQRLKPCIDGWKKLCENLNPEMDMGKEVSILEILESNGVKHAFWALKTQDYRDYCLILADVAESVLHIFEERYPEDERPRKAIKATRDWYAGKITDKELRAIADAAADAADDANTAYAAYAAHTAVYAATASYAAYITDVDAGYITAADAAAAYASCREKQWKKNEAILRKYLGGKNEVD